MKRPKPDSNQYHLCWEPTLAEAQGLRRELSDVAHDLGVPYQFADHRQRMEEGLDQRDYPHPAWTWDQRQHPEVDFRESIFDFVALLDQQIADVEEELAEDVDAWEARRTGDQLRQVSLAHVQEATDLLVAVMKGAKEASVEQIAAARAVCSLRED